MPVRCICGASSPTRRATCRRRVKTLVYLALIHLEQKSIGEAEAAATRALALATDDAEAINAMGQVHYEQQKAEEAMALFSRALALKPDLADTHNNIGTILKENGKLAEARDHFIRAIEIKAARERLLFQSRRYEEIRSRRSASCRHGSARARCGDAGAGRADVAELCARQGL